MRDPKRPLHGHHHGLTLAKPVHDVIGPALEIAFADRHDGDADHTHADVSKATEPIGYEPTRVIPESGKPSGSRARTSSISDVDEFVQWYRERRDWDDPLVVNSCPRVPSWIAGIDR